MCVVVVEMEPTASGIGFFPCDDTFVEEVVGIFGDHTGLMESLEGSFEWRADFAIDTDDSGKASFD
jgi:hypothetical protein